MFLCFYLPILLQIRTIRAQNNLPISIPPTGDIALGITWGPGDSNEPSTILSVLTAASSETTTITNHATVTATRVHSWSEAVPSSQMPTQDFRSTNVLASGWTHTPSPVLTTTSTITTGTCRVTRTLLDCDHSWKTGDLVHTIFASLSGTDFGTISGSTGLQGGTSIGRPPYGNFTRTASGTGTPAGIF